MCAVDCTYRITYVECGGAHICKRSQHIRQQEEHMQQWGSYMKTWADESDDEDALDGLLEDGYDGFCDPADEI